MNEPEVDIDKLNEEIAELKEQLDSIKKNKKKIMYNVFEVKNEIEAREQKKEKDAAEAKRLASLTPSEQNMEMLNETLNLYRIFGAEVMSEVKNGVSVAFHHWYKGVKVDTNSVAVLNAGQGKIEIQRHSLPPSSMRWMKPVPCVSPHASIPDTLDDIRKSAFCWNYRYHQLEEFKASHPEIKTSNMLSLLSIKLEANIKDTEAKKKTLYGITLLYEPHSIYPDNIEVKILNDSEEKSLMENANIEALKNEVEPFKAMSIADAFYFIFESRDDTTRRTITSL